MASSGLYSVQVSEPPAANTLANNGSSSSSASTEPSYVCLMLGPANFTVIDDAADVAAQRARMEAAGIGTVATSSASGDTSNSANASVFAPVPDATTAAAAAPSTAQEIADQNKRKKHKPKVQQRYVLRVKLFRTAPFKLPPEEARAGREDDDEEAEEEFPTYDGSSGESEDSEIESEDSAAEENERW